MAPRSNAMATRRSQPVSDKANRLMAEALEFFKKGLLGPAEAAAKKVLSVQKGHTDARHLLAMIKFRQNDLEGAVTDMRALAAEFPERAPVLNDLGMLLTRLELYKEAEIALVRALELMPEVPGFHLNLGNVYKNLHLSADAERHYRAAIYHNPQFADAYQLLSAVLIEQGRREEATRMAEMAARLTPDNPRSQTRLGDALSEAGLFDLAKAAFERAIALAPDQPRLRVELANALAGQGDLTQAEKILRDVIAAHPKLAGAHASLAHIIKYKPDEPHLTQLEALVADPDMADKEGAIALHFALAKAYEDVGAYQKAFAQSLAGNALVHEDITYPRAQNERANADRIAAFTPEVILRLGEVGCMDETPIFIIGMPRSGTTLTEQILSSHSDVHGAGELSFFQFLARELNGKKGAHSSGELLSKITGEDLRELGEAYVAQIRNFSKDARFIVDKMPGNYNHLGLIRLALPKAKVIYCRRNAPDNCISIFNLRFAAAGLNYSYDLEDVGHTYKLHEELMAHWRKVIPEFFIENRYEDMIADSEAQTRRLLDFCGLEWQDACAQFFKTERTVHTASRAQVRRPIYKSSVDRWKRYGPAVQPLLDALGWDQNATTAP